MKKTLLSTTLSATLFLAANFEAHAFGGPPGGPNGNGSYFPNDGTFSAVVRGENLIGTMQFSTSAGSGTSTAGADAAAAGGSGSTGVSTIYYDGDTYIGNSQGSYDPQVSGMSVTFQAGAQGQGEKEVVVQTAVTTQQTTQVISANGTVTPVQTQQTEFVPTRQINFFDALYFNGAADCKTSNAFPNQKFSGSGEAEFQQLIFTGNTPFLDAVRLPISVTGVRLSNTSSSFATKDIRPPSVSEFSVLVP
jgi:hypothetical protein